MRKWCRAGAQGHQGGRRADDPHKDYTTTRYAKLTFDEAITRNLGIMDRHRSRFVPSTPADPRVLLIVKPGALQLKWLGENEGTLVYA